MIPIGDDKLRNAPTPFVTWFLILLNLVIFIYELTLTPQLQDAMLFNHGAIPAEVMRGSHLQNIFSAMFIHAGWMHFIGNMLFLWVFGDNIEAALGRIGFLAYYIAGGAVATLAHAMASPNNLMPMVGASGAISACLGSYIIMYPASKVNTIIPLGFFFTTVRVSAWIFLGLWIILQVLNGLFFTSAAEQATSGGIAWWAHIGGFSYGLLVGFLFRSRARRYRLVLKD